MSLCLQLLCCIWSDQQVLPAQVVPTGLSLQGQREGPIKTCLYPPTCYILTANPRCGLNSSHVHCQLVLMLCQGQTITQFSPLKIVAGLRPLAPSKLYRTVV